ncbi:helix-turn-helix domain-containing protein, partial [Lysobacter sp. 1R34A]|uniref:ArsR/SmtB family transcription factor n=1 Tax=Lysobacter sp. 1R34A TaxID=3445786 RepID=UPI003EEFADCE
MRPLHHPAVDDIEMTAVLYALADPVRLGIVRSLSRDHPVSCVGACIDEELPRATLSRHFDVLRSAGLVNTVKSGTQYLNTLRCDDLERRFPGLLQASRPGFLPEATAELATAGLVQRLETVVLEASPGNR